MTLQQMKMVMGMDGIIQVTGPTISTTGGTATAAWGGNELFPMENPPGYNPIGRLIWGTRTGGGVDNVYTWFTFGPDSVPPYYVAGALWDPVESSAGALGGIDDGNTDIDLCISIANSGRFEVASGQTATRIAKYRYRVCTGSNPTVEAICPQTTVVHDIEVKFTFNFAPL
jgi:hypothetical protein